MASTTGFQRKHGLLEFETLHELQEVACNVSLYPRICLLEEKLLLRNQKCVSHYFFRCIYVRFSAVHTMRLKVYPENPLYGTYNEITSQFEYLNYEDFESKVQECRVLLKNLGKWILAMEL